MQGDGILVVDVGGNNVKLKHSAHDERRKTKSGPTLTPDAMVAAVRELAHDWTYDRVTIGCPGAVLEGRLVLEPVNLGKGWVAFDYQAAFDRPVRLVNDAVMQAIGSYAGGKMLFLGLGTGLGAALVGDHVAVPLEVAHLPYTKKFTFEDCVGKRGLDRLGQERWEKAVHDSVARLKAAMVADRVVLGGGNTKLLKKLPPDCTAGDNQNAFSGGVRLWQEQFRVL
jgi:polyphosphate glucokinase